MNKKELKQIAMRIKEKRKTYGYTQEQLAEQLELSYSYYTKIENGYQTKVYPLSSTKSLCMVNIAMFTWIVLLAALGYPFAYPAGGVKATAGEAKPVP